MFVYEDMYFLLMIGFDISYCEMYISSCVVVVCCMLIIMCTLLCDHPPTPLILEDGRNERLEETHLCILFHISISLFA